MCREPPLQSPSVSLADVCPEPAALCRIRKWALAASVRGCPDGGPSTHAALWHVLGVLTPVKGETVWWPRGLTTADRRAALWDIPMALCWEEQGRAHTVLIIEATCFDVTFRLLKSQYRHFACSRLCTWCQFFFHSFLAHGVYRVAELGSELVSNAFIRCDRWPKSHHQTQALLCVCVGMCVPVCV